MLAWLVVVFWFAIAMVAEAILAPRGGTSANGLLIWVPSDVLKLRLAEAALLTLIASLWFDSLGSGQWWLLFLLIGVLVGLPLWERSGTPAIPRRARITGIISYVARYVVAGGLLAWRLS